MKFKSLLAGAYCILLAANVFAQPIAVSKEAAAAMKQVKPKHIKEHIRYLADDRLQGRLPGTPGYQLAVDYVTDQFKAMGIAPAGEQGTYLQKVRLRRAFTTDNYNAQLTTNKQQNSYALEAGKDITIYPHPEESNITVEAPLVFAGYGISAPELGYDDYANIDAKGKIIVIMRGAPAKFHSTVSAYSMDMMTVLKNAIAHGAVGVIVGSSNPSIGLPNLQKGIVSVMGADGKVAASRSFVSSQIKMLAAMHAKTLDSLFIQAGLNLKEITELLKSGTPASAPLHASLKAQYKSTFQDFDSYNVIGKITGADSRLKEEYIVHSAHLDHLGVGTPVEGDSIYNGAHDNASGVASLLEIAKVYSRLKEKPKRSILIVMVTGEEMGLLGSAYFAKNPTIPMRNIVANINTDMPTIIAPLLSVVPLGAEHSSLALQVEQASKYFGLEVQVDPEPEQNRFIRSDQYSFVMQGIPALHIKYGNRTKSGENNLHLQVQEWRAKYYHKPQDEINGVFDFNAGKAYVQLNFLIGYQVAQESSRPQWNKGDFFGERFGSSNNK